MPIGVYRRLLTLMRSWRGKGRDMLRSLVKSYEADAMVTWG